jgi:hypothetical protein
MNARARERVAELQLLGALLVVVLFVIAGRV